MNRLYQNAFTGKRARFSNIMAYPWQLVSEGIEDSGPPMPMSIDDPEPDDADDDTPSAPMFDSTPADTSTDTSSDFSGGGGDFGGGGSSGDFS